MTAGVLRAQTRINVTLDQARQWFLSLKQRPERYQFDTHDGFEFVEGDFGQVGARFRTRERFLLLGLGLLFELTEVGESEFRFRLIKPLSLGIWGAFSIRDGDDQNALLSLDIGSTTQLGRLLLSSYPVAAAVRRQIEGEVRHIKASMEEVRS